MSKILDLNSFVVVDTRPVTLLDGTTVNILKPTQQMLLDMSGIDRINKNDIEGMLGALNKITFDILNHNREHRHVPMTVVEGYPMEVKIGVINYFKDFMEEVLSDPNYKSPQSQPYPQAKKGNKKKSNK